MKKLLYLLLFIPLVSFGQLAYEDRLFLIYQSNNKTNQILCVNLTPYPKQIDYKVVVNESCVDWDREFIYNNFENPYNVTQDRILYVNTYMVNSSNILKLTITIKDSEYRTIYNKTSSVKSYGFVSNDPDRTVGYHYLEDAVKIHLQDLANTLTQYGQFVKLQKIQKEREIQNEPPVGEWKGNGSGIIISESGHIVTNYHVIEKASDIEVEFILNDKVQKFSAEVVQSDKTNDLAILKIEDINFKLSNKINYNFKTRSSDVGTKIYAYGYPYALLGMGKEIKVTDGMISSKTGFDGNITTYQITAPIQEGNSGGPLFDENGNFIGINSSGIRKDVADNVGYTIKSSYVLNLIDVLPKSIDLPLSTKLQSLPLTEQIKEISKYVVLIKVK